MQILQSLLAQTDPEISKKIEEIHQTVRNMDDPIQLILILSIVTTLLVLTIFVRQKRIARNQVNIAEMIKEINKK